MNQSSDDPLFRQLGRMSLAVPDETHSTSVRARCHAVLARRSLNADARTPWRWYIELAGIGTLAFIYVVAVVHDMLASYGVLAVAR